MHIQLTDEQLATIKNQLRARAELDGDLSQCALTLEHIEQHERDQATETAQKYRKAARDNHYDEGELEIDEDAMVSIGGDNGAYVQAWIWIPNSEAGVKDVYDLEAESQAP